MIQRFDCSHSLARQGCVFAILLLSTTLFTGCGDGNDIGQASTAVDAAPEPSEVAIEEPIDVATQDVPVQQDRSLTSDERSGAEPSEIDWDSIDSIGPIRGMRELMGLLRHLDVRFRGERTTLIIVWQKPGHAVDELGHHIPLAAEDWKGVLDAILSRAASSPDGIAHLRAMPSEMYDDGYGNVPRHNYRVFIESSQRLRFENDGPMQ